MIGVLNFNIEDRKSFQYVITIMEEKKEQIE